MSTARTRYLPLFAVVAVSLAPGAPVQAQDTARRRLPSDVVRSTYVPRLRPNVVRQPYADAEAQLRKLGLTVVSRDSEVTSGRGGIVLRQIPPGETPIRGTLVDTLILARPREQRQVAVPGVIGKPYGIALQEIRGAGLEPMGPPLTPAEKSQARISAQSPTGGEQALVRSMVKLEVVIDDRVPVPPVVGSDTIAARRRLEEAELRTGRVELEQAHQPVGTVIRQRPEVGDSVKRGTRVALWVSQGEPATTLTEVPRLLEMTLEQARIALENARLALGQVDFTPTENGQDLVVHQRPHAGEKLHFGDRVHVTIAVPQPMTRVPRLLGLSRTFAEDSLRISRLAVGAVRLVVDSLSPEGVVIKQSVAEGERLPLGSRVDLEIARQPERVVVPSVVGLARAIAEDSIRRSRLAVGPVTFAPDTRDGFVKEQMPEANRRVVPGSPIAIVISQLSTPVPPPTSSLPPTPAPEPKPAVPGARLQPEPPGNTRQPRRPERPAQPPPGPERVLMPAVVDSALSWAQPHLSTLGFRNVVVDYRQPMGPVQLWIVTTQVPDAGALLLPSALIRLSARPLRGILVPNLVGMDETSARVETEGEELLFRVGQRARSYRLTGTRVTAQHPPVDSLVAPATKVFVDISDPVPPIALAGAGGAVALAGLALALRLRGNGKLNGKPQPATTLTFHGEMTRAEPSLSPKADGLVRKPVVSLVGTLEWGASELISPRNDLIEWEKRYDG